MTKEKYTFIRDAGPDDWRALPREFSMGEVVTRFIGHTYGLDRDDMLYDGVESIPCNVGNHVGFFTVPVEWLCDEDGKSPVGDYVNIKRIK